MKDEIKLSIYSEDDSDQTNDSDMDSLVVSDETLYEKLTSCRWTLTYMACLYMLLLYALRINMGIAMVCMVKPANITTNPTNSSTNQCANRQIMPVNDTLQSRQAEVFGDVEWDKTTQGWVLSSFFYGYIVTPIPGGWLAGKYGGKRVMLGGMVIYGLVTILIPPAARYDGVNYTVSAWLVIALRVIAGLATGVVFPAWHTLCGKWAPPYERSKIYALCLSGTTVGNVLMLGAGGFFCEWTDFDGGWPSIFYIGGSLCLLFCVLWWFLVYDSPAEHPKITEKEKTYILVAKAKEGSVKEKNQKVPWLAILKSPAVWAINVAITANSFGTHTLLTKLPAFMKEVLGYDVRSSGLLSALPYIVMFIIGNTGSQVVDTLRQRQLLSTTAARKIANTIALIIPAIFLVATGHIPCDMNYLGVVFLTIAVSVNALTDSGYSTNTQDIAPRYAGEIFGICNAISTIPGMIAPSLVNAMTPNGTAEEWQNVFYVWGVVFLTGAVFYAIFAQGDLQPWAHDEITKHKVDNKSVLDDTPT